MWNYVAEQITYNLQEEEKANRGGLWSGRK